MAAVVLFLVANDSVDEEQDPDQPRPAQTTTDEPGTGDGDGRDGEGGGDGGEPEPEPEPEESVETIKIEGGQPVGGVAELTYKEGDTVRLRVVSDVADEVHIHGYDFIEEVEAGGSVQFQFTADLTGVFEVELEESVVPIAELTIEP